jgi:hypothetical protein
MHPSCFVQGHHGCTLAPRSGARICRHVPARGHWRLGAAFLVLAILAGVALAALGPSTQRVPVAVEHATYVDDDVDFGLP